jgi:anaerobic selenocysteine-containing dehydrogenase
MDLAATLEDPQQARALVCWNINIAASNPEQERLRRALGQDGLFTVVVDLFQTDTADLADVVLPAASFLEFDDLVSSYFNLTLSAQVKAMEPPGAALPNQEIFRRLARAMGLGQPALYEEDGPLLDALCGQAGVTGGFAALAEAGTVQLFAEPVIQFADLSFPTPSGRIEIASARAASAGLPRTPLPLADPRPATGRLRLLSPGSRWLMNSTYGNDPGIGGKLGHEEVYLHPADAAARGLEEGAAATLANEVGTLAVQVRLDPTLLPGVALASKGRWPKHSRGHANVNSLNPGRKADMGESTAVHSVEIAVERA